MSGGDYGRVRHTFWTDPDIKRALSPEQKALLLYYFTSPHRTLIGLYYCPLEYAASETGIPLASVREWTLGTLARFVTYDESTEEVLVHRAGKHQVGDELKERDNQRKAIEKALAEAHSPRLIAKFLDLYPHWSLAVEKPVVPPPSKPLESPSEAKAVAVTEQEHTHSKPATPEPAAGSAEDYRLKVDLETYATDHDYGPRDRLIAIGEDISAWRTPTGDLAPLSERLRCLKLADAHLAEPGCPVNTLRSALKFVLAQQFDPLTITAAADRQPAKASPAPKQPKPADRLAQLKAEHPEEFAEALAEFEKYPWWEDRLPQQQYTDLRDAIREKVNTPIRVIR